MKRTLILVTLALLTLAVIPSDATVTCTPLGSTTTNLGLCEPASGETSWATAINGNWTQLDTVFFDGSLSPRFKSGGFGAAASGTTGDVSALRLRAVTGSSPSCTVNCGTGSAVSGSDSFFVITGPTTPAGASTIGVTFHGTWAAAPACIATEQSGSNNGSNYTAYVGTSTTMAVVKLGGNLTTNEKVAVQCAGIS